MKTVYNETAFLSVLILALSLFIVHAYTVSTIG